MTDVPRFREIPEDPPVVRVASVMPVIEEREPKKPKKPKKGEAQPRDSD